LKQKLSNIFFLIAFIEILSAILIFPEIAKYWRTDFISYSDAMLNYSVSVFIISIVTILLGILLRIVKGEIVLNIFLFLIIISLIFVSDRLLLAKIGLGLWEYDSQLFYKHRPSKTVNWGSDFNNKIVRINSSGFHDDEFLQKKDKNEFRILCLGNSITMGHGVSRDETFATQLEKFEFNNKNINAYNLGVQGYSTFQENIVLQNIFSYNPDLVILEFCYNDITEPFYVNKEFGGLGFDYHNVFQIKNEVLSFIVNETGYGRYFTKKIFYKELTSLKKIELLQVDTLSIKPKYKQFAEGWKLFYKSIQLIKNKLLAHNIPFIVAIFPYRNQLFNVEFQNAEIEVSKILKNEKVNFLIIREELEKKKDEIKLNSIFLDEDHYTKDGHKLISEILFKKIYDIAN